VSLALHLPALQVVVPLAAAPLAVLARRANAAFLLVTLASWAAFAVAVLLWLQVGSQGAISYALGSWAPPLGIEYRVDRLSAFVLVLVAGIAAVALPYSRRSIEAEIPREQHYLFYAMFALCLTGLLGITITGDAFNIFVFLEISSLSTYVLIALGRDRRALVASYQYLVMGTIGATFIVIGVGLLYLKTGTLNLVDMGVRLQEMTSHRPVLAALGFLTVGISLKLALFPLHQWLPNAYTYAPSAVTAFLAATATKVSVYVLLRFYYSVFGESLVFQRLPLPQLMLALSLAAMFAASAIAIFQDDLKRLLAYSSVGQIGYITLGLSFDSASGLTATVVHLFNHGVTKAALFLLVGCAVAVVGGSSLSRLAGLGKVMPLTAFGIVLGGLGLIGVPGTAGFVSKWYLVLAALEQGQWWLAMAIVASSLLAVAYVWRFVEIAYFRAPPAGLPARRLQVLARVHLDQAADGAMELVRQHALGVQLLGRDLRRDDQVDPPVVEHVDQPDEAPRLGGHRRTHARHARDDHRVELAGDLEIVVLRTRTAAQRAEVEPDRASGAAQRAYLAMLDQQARILVARLGQAREDLAQRPIGHVAQRRLVGVHVGDRALPVVDAGVHAQHVDVALEQLDRRQDAVAVQPCGVQPVGPVVRRDDESDAMREQPAHQPLEDHGVGDVGDVEFVEADQPIAARHVRRHRIERIGATLELVERAVHAAHELVEVQPRLAHDGHRRIEAVHEEALAAAHAAVQPHAARHVRAQHELLDAVGARGLEGDEGLAHALQALDRSLLRGIGRVAALGEGLRAGLGDAHLRERAKESRSSFVRTFTRSARACRWPRAPPRAAPPTSTDADARCGRCPRPTRGTPLPASLRRSTPRPSRRRCARRAPRRWRRRPAP
jgi:multicomponent Na+:H+ antiporter subunit D